MAKMDELPAIAKLGIALTIALVLGAGAYFGVLKGMDDANRDALAKLKVKQRENDELRAYEPRLAELERNIATLQAQMEIQKKIVPDEKEADKFINVMQDTATSAGIEIRRFTSKGITRKEYYAEVPFEMEVDGPYYAILNFMDRVARLERIVNVEGLKMSGIKGKGGRYDYAPTESVSVGYTAKTFFSNSAGDAAPASATAK